MKSHERETRSLRDLYEAHRDDAVLVLNEVRETLEQLLSQNSLKTVIPLEQRIKSWESLQQKLEGTGQTIEGISEVHDFAGLRAVFLFSREASAVAELIESTFSIRRGYDTQDRLAPDQFGYASQHYVVKRAKGLEYDSRGLPKIKPVWVELQIRTLAQHTWAAVSHKLQYKNEKSVPFTVRRGLYRAAALLELVDLEFERVMVARDDYRARAPDSNEPLNVDSLAKLLDERLPLENRAGDGEAYDDLLSDVAAMDVKTATQLDDLIRRYLPGVLAEEKRLVAYMRVRPESARRLQGEARFERGVLYNHAGLLRTMLSRAFDKRWETWLQKKK